MATIYRKSPKGQLEIETRSHRLTPRFRNLLILVDGRRSDDDLRQLLPGAGIDGLRALLEGGFIEVIGETGVAAREPSPRALGAVPSAPARAAPKAPSGAKLFEQRRRDIVRALTDQAGPMAETLAIRIERAASRQELAELVETAAALLGNLRGQTVASAFRQRFAAGDEPG